MAWARLGRTRSRVGLGDSANRGEVILCATAACRIGRHTLERTREGLCRKSAPHRVEDLPHSQRVVSRLAAINSPVAEERLTEDRDQDALPGFVGLSLSQVGRDESLGELNRGNGCLSKVTYGEKMPREMPTLPRQARRHLGGWHRAGSGRGEGVMVEDGELVDEQRADAPMGGFGDHLPVDELGALGKGEDRECVFELIATVGIG